MTTGIRARYITLVAIAVGLALAAPPVDAATPTTTAKAQKAKRYRVPTPYQQQAGGAQIRVAAPAEVVRKVVTDYQRYKTFIPRFDKSQVVGRSGKSTDVYLQIPILNGAAKLWAVVRFGPPKTEAGEEIIRGKLVKGNLERFDAVWRIKKIDETSTQLKLEMLVVPKIPFPKSYLTKRAEYAADKAVTGSRKRAELNARRRRR